MSSSATTEANSRQPTASPVHLNGTVERITFYNPENGFSVVKLKVRGRRAPVAVVGTLPAVQPGETLELTGCWRTDARHGAQFQPTTAEVSRPSDVDGIVRYLSSGLIPQIGPVLAERIVAAFGPRTLEILDATPERVRQVPGIGPQRAEAIRAAWVEHLALRSLMAFLAEHGLDTRYAPRLVAAYGAAAPKVVRANPYRLVADVPGFGFAAADRLGQALGVRPTSPARLQAAVQAALQRAAEQGHTRLEREALRARITDSGLFDDVAIALIDAAISQLTAGGTIVAAGTPSALPSGETPAPSVTPTGSGRLRIFEPPSPARAAELDGPRDDLHSPGQSDSLGLARLVRAEGEVAARLRALARRAGLTAPRVEAWLAGDAEVRGLSAEQREAVRLAASSGSFVLTGGPGVGKTTTTRVLVRCLQALGRSVALAAPTGKAARRLGEVVGLEARTIHRLLGAEPRGFRHGPREPLPFDTLIVDEASMLDTQLACSVVRAIGPRAQLILVGDADQLPSVGPGQVLRDVLASGAIPAVRLETIFRQAAQSRIVTNAHRIRRGELPDLAPATALTAGIDCVFVPASAARSPQFAAEWAAVRLPRALGVAPADVQTLAPLTRVCQAVNSLLQQRLNPGRGQPERPHGALPLRVGDRVIQTRNNYRLGVFNGEGGTLVEIQPEGLTVAFDDGRRVAYDAADLLDLDHAYCLTVHRAQGSEWPGVVVLASSSYGPMLSRNLLYTAITRARRAVVIVGDEPAIARAVAETRDQQRSTGLRDLLMAPAS